MIREDYQKNGYVLRRDFFSETDLTTIEPILCRFHEQWMENNSAYYKDGAINSAYITHADRLSKLDRETLFKFISMDRLVTIARDLVPTGPAFMNTQLFFNPKDHAQKNYWHRDIQYRPDDVAKQQKLLCSKTVLHFRMPMADEPGIELVPGTHARWDDTQEFETRMGKNGRSSSDTLPGGKCLALKRGDLLVFSANMIHRGLYGGDRFAFDVIFCDTDPELLEFVDPKCLPGSKMLENLPNPNAFEATWEAIKKG